tara:strand:- start:1316 stop:2044 length:729 start_codon:yes stop_codon:yes gene_type:complete
VFDFHKDISVIQNFICTNDARLKMIENNLPKMAELFGESKFYVTYNSHENLQKIQQLYADNIRRLSFTHSESSDWAVDTLAMLKDVKTPYVMYVCEDFDYYGTRQEWDDMLYESLSENNSDFVMLAKIEKYSRPEWHHYYSGAGKHSYFYSSKNSPSKVLSIDAIYRTEFLIERLEEYSSLYSHHLPNNYETYYKHDNNLRRFDIKCSIPKDVLLFSYHPEDYSEVVDRSFVDGPLGRKING